MSCTKPLKVEVPEFTTSNTGPFLMQIEYLELIDSLRKESPVLTREYERLISGADSLLNVTFKYVPDKPYLPPSGDLHDYMSLHRYSYPDSSGNYTIINDGKTNPEFYEYDKPKLEKISAGVFTLALAYYYTKNEKYAQKASTEIKNWFLNPETRMNPNMNFASIRPGVSEGISEGIVSASDFVDIIEASSLIYNSPHWSPDLHHDLKEWFYKFYLWIYHHYPTDAYHSSNISTWTDVQRGVYLLFTEQEDKLNSVSHIQPVSKRLADQIEPNGFQPQEASRGIPQHYVYFNLKAYMKLSLLRKNHYLRNGKDRDWPVLRSCVLNDCQFGGLKISLDDISSFIQGKQKATLFSTDSEFNKCRYLEVFRPAAVAFSSSEYEEAVQQLISEGCRNSDLLLTFPSPEEL